MRILAAASVFEALRSARAHRSEYYLEDASKILHQEVASGRLDYAAASAVCEVQGQPGPERPEYPAQLSEREVDVLRLVATAHLVHCAVECTT